MGCGGAGNGIEDKWPLQVLWAYEENILEGKVGAQGSLQKLETNGK